MKSLASKLRETLEYLELIAFPSNPLPIVLREEPPFYGDPQFLFAHCPTDFSQDEYRIHIGNLDSYIKAGAPYHAHVMLEVNDPDFGTRGVPFTEQETFLAMALHEVRHRVQYHNRIDLIDHTHTEQTGRCHLWGKMQKKHYQNMLGGAHEFDALFIGHYGAYELRRDRLKTEGDVRKLLFITPSEFLNREK